MKRVASLLTMLTALAGASPDPSSSSEAVVLRLEPPPASISDLERPPESGCGEVPHTPDSVIRWIHDPARPQYWTFTVLPNGPWQGLP